MPGLFLATVALQTIGRTDGQTSPFQRPPELSLLGRVWPYDPRCCCITEAAL